MDPTAGQITVDPGDFDALGALGAVVVALRTHAVESGIDAAATISAPDGWHRVVVTARGSGHVVVAIRYTHLSTSRWHNVAEAVSRRGWQLDEDREGASVRFPPGTEPSDAAFEALAATSLAGAPGDLRTVTAVDGRGAVVPLT